MPVGVRSATQGWVEGTQQLTITGPAGATSGDLLLVSLHWDYSAAAGSSIIAPAGWSQLGATQATPSGSYYPVNKLFTKAADPDDDGASFVFGTGAANSSKVGVMVALTGADLTAPAAAAPAWATGAAGTSHVAPTIASGAGQTSGDLLVCTAASDYYDAARGNSYTPPSGMTERGDISAQFTYMGLATLALTGTGATGTKTFTPNRASQDAYRAMSVVIRQAAAAAGPEPGRYFMGA